MTTAHQASTVVLSHLSKSLDGASAGVIERKFKRGVPTIGSILSFL
jgi:hypothetical protein